MPPGYVNDDGFPYHVEPDGNRFAPHHHLLGLYGVALLAIVSGIELGAAPLVTLLGAFVGLFSFLHLWYHYYPTLGALGSLLGLTIAAVGLAAIDPMLLPHRLLGLLFVLVAADDVLQHAFGLATPLDRVWNRYIFSAVREA